jgi:hypothetical protein
MSPERFCLCPWRGDQSHNAYKARHRTVIVHYQHHFMTGQELRVKRKHKRENDELLYCEIEDGLIITIPGWMTDAARCSAVSSGDPLVAVSALRGLRDFLDTRLAACRYGDFQISRSAKEETGEEQIQMDDVEATRIVGSKRAGDEPAGVQQAGVDRRPCGAGHRACQTPKRRGGEAI